IAAIIAGKEGVHFLLRRNLYQCLGMREEGAIAADGAREEDAPIFSDAVGDERGVESFLRAIDPDKLPAQIAAGEGIVMLEADGAGVVESSITHHDDHGNAEGRR